MDGGVRLGFDDFLLRLQQVAAILSEIVFLLAGVKFEHPLAGVNLGAGTCQRDDLQRAPGDGRSRDRSGLGSTQNSFGENFELKIDLFDGSRWNLEIRCQHGGLAAGEAASPQREGKKKCS